MSNNSNKKEKKEDLNHKEIEVKKDNQEIPINKENEIFNNKKLLLQKLSLPLNKLKKSSINNKQVRDKNNIIFRNNQNISSKTRSTSYISEDNLNNTYNYNENINLKNINMELMNNLESYEKENNKLKNVIFQLNNELIKKEKYIGESEQMILKLKQNYLNLSNNYEQMEIKFKNLQNNKNEDDISSKSNKEKDEIEKYKIKNNELIQNLDKIRNDYNKIIKELKDISFAYQELKEKSSNFIEMIKDRERIIEQNEKKIKELNQEINNKDEQLKLLSKYKNEEYLENMKKVDKNNTNSFILDKDDYKINIFPVDEQFNINILETKILNNNNIGFKLQEALKDILYIPSNAHMSITKEYLINMNFKTELIKLECFSNYYRELNYVKFLENFSRLINEYSLKEIINKIYILKSNYEKILFDNAKYSNDNNKLKTKIKDLYLYNYKIKDELYIVNNNFNIKINNLVSLYEMRIKQLENHLKRNILYKKNNISYKKEEMKNSSYIDIKKNKSLKYNYSLEHTNSFFYKTTNKNNNNLLYFKIKESLNKKKNCLNINCDSTIKDNFYQENDKLKSEIERLKNEMSLLIKDINDQQKELFEIKNINNNNEEFILNLQNKIKNFYSEITYKLKNKNLINIIYNFFESLLQDFNNNKVTNIKRNKFISFEYYDLNKEIFIKSEYMKYLLIYEFTDINEIINVFYFIVNNSKQNLDKIELSKNTLSKSSEKNDIDNNVKNEFNDLKNQSIINESLIEIIKNYLIVAEKIKLYSNDIDYKDNSNKIFNIFSEGLNYRIEDISEKNAFMRKLIIKLFEKIYIQ